MASFALEPAHFESDSDVPPDRSRYSPSSGDTYDVARIATVGERVGLVALNAVGTVYADRYTYRAGELTRTNRIPLTQPRRVPHQDKHGSTYDVFGWLQNVIRVHAAMSVEGVLYAALVLQKSEVSTVDERWGSHLTDGLGDAGKQPNSSLWFTALFTISASGDTQPAEARVLGPFWDSLLLTLDISRGRCFYGGLAREGENYISKPMLFELGGPKRIVDTTHNAVALQAVAVDSTGQV